MIRRDFVANASHELRTPLTILRGYLETLLENPEDAQDSAYRTRALQVMSKHLQRIMHLVEGMLTVSRLENASAPSLKQELFDFEELVNDVMLQLESMVQGRQATVNLRISPTPFPLHGDRFYWSQIIFNLVENALKVNAAPGLVLEIAAQKSPEGEIFITVQDNGIGIEAEDLPYVFNRFYRADKTGQVKGTGLGLSIVRHAVEAHNGEITVTSTPGERTQFCIRLQGQNQG